MLKKNSKGIVLIELLLIGMVSVHLLKITKAGKSARNIGEG